MKKFLVVFTVLTIQAAHAENSSWYTFESRTCSTGQSFQESTYQDHSGARYQVSEDRKKLTKQSTVDGLTVSQEFNLTLYGKNTYMATQVILNGDAIHFYVVVSEDLSEISINTSDTMGASCGGGLVMTKLEKEAPSSQINETIFKDSVVL